jgi:asparagine synthase (glutamine-hydrolysing)
MGDRHFGLMLSGGLDSSLIAAIAARLLPHKPIAFSVGFIDSPDLANAATVAKHLDLRHDILIITPEQCLQAIPGKRIRR